MQVVPPAAAPRGALGPHAIGEPLKARPDGCRSQPRQSFRTHVDACQRSSGRPSCRRTCRRTRKSGYHQLLSAYGCPIRTSFLPAARGGQTEVLAWIAGRVTKGLQWDDGVSEAARRCHLDALKFLLASGHGSRTNEEWIQFLACKGGHLPILQWFFAKGIPFGDTVVFVAATRGDLAILEWLRSCGLQFSTGDFECALRSATKRGRVDTLMWIRELAPQVFFRHRDSIAVKALQLAQMVPTREIQQTLDFLESMGAPLHGERLKKIITRIWKLKRFGEKPSKHVSRDWSQT
jgi:hypothetical protein